jgi:3-oxoacyl-[acyl-carrier protein] reductase
MFLKDKVAIITGAGRGIGKEIAKTFAQAGAKVVLADVAVDFLAQTQAELQSLGAELLTVAVDVTKTEQVENLVNKTLDKFKRIDILINNAGITRDALLVRMKEEDWDAVLNINLKGAFLCSRAVAKVMMRQTSGSIVNIASIIGQIGNIGQANYAASKAGIIGLTKTSARELALRGIRVNAIAPGFIATEMTAKLPPEIKDKMLAQIPLGRFGQPEDVAKLALFLSSQEAAYITGQVIRIDGGMVIC